MGLYHANCGPDLKTQLKSIHRLLNRLSLKRDRRITDGCELDLLYVLPTTTPSSVLNLGAVISAQSVDLLRSVLVLPDGVETPPDGVPPEIPSETYRSLLGAIAYGERVSALGRAWRRACRILEAVRELDPRVAAGMRPFEIPLWERLFEAELCALACARALARWKPDASFPRVICSLWNTRCLLAPKPAESLHFCCSTELSAQDTFHFTLTEFLVWGEPDLKTMVDLGARSDSIVVLGMPSSDKLFNTERDNEKAGGLLDRSEL